jgi:hypothetical protein
MFTNKLNGFCEGQIYGGPPEYINAFTSLTMLFIGLIGLKNNIHTNRNIQMLFSSLTINGAASFLYHWTNYYGWGLFDALTMILIAIFGTCAMMEEIQYLYNIRHPTLKTTLLPMTYFTIMLGAPGLGYDGLFRIMFGSFLIIIAITLAIIYDKLIKIDNLSYHILNNAYIGVLYVIMAAICWIIIEVNCNLYYFVKYLPGHAFWHIFISYGCYHVSLLLIALHNHRTGGAYVYNHKQYFPTIVENIVILRSRYSRI